MPIIRTFDPLVTGIARMIYHKFIFNILGDVFWIASFLLGGYYIGNIPAVKENIICAPGHRRHFRHAGIY
jgi:membrane-associated protein